MKGRRRWYLDEHGPLCLHHHLQQGLDQSLRGGGDQVEKVDDGRADLHLLRGEGGTGGVKEGDKS